MQDLDRYRLRASRRVVPLHDLRAPEGVMRIFSVSRRRHVPRQRRGPVAGASRADLSSLVDQRAAVIRDDDVVVGLGVIPSGYSKRNEVDKRS